MSGGEDRISMKNPENSIPIIIGITGHRALYGEDVPALRTAFKNEIEKLILLCPDSEFLLLTSLAEGADLLCADTAAELGVGICAVLPMEAEEYTKEYPPEEKARFEYHIAHAKRVMIVPYTEPVPVEMKRDYLFRQAGIYVSAHSHVLFALWDGSPGKSGCGTAEAVDFSLKGAYSPKRGMALRSDSNEAVIHIFTPRGTHRERPAGSVQILGNWAAVREALLETDRFNRLAAELAPETRRLLPEDCTGDEILSRMEQVYLAAGRLSMSAQKTYRTILALLAFFCTALTVAFLLYDEAQTTMMILVCGVMLLAAWVCSRFADRSECHRRYIEYRALAECMRVQSFLRFSGSSLEASDMLSWTQQEETAWILDALCALTIGRPPLKKRNILKCWVEDQREYHQGAAKKTGREFRTSENIVRIAMTLSVLLYITAVLFEILFGGAGGVLYPLGADAEQYRTGLKIILGSISAVTLFVANYYGKLSLTRKLSDHTKMERFYKRMQERMDLCGQTDELLTVLAREELIENGNWCSYQRDNRPGISL